MALDMHFSANPLYVRQSVPDPTLDRLFSFAHLKPGWDYGRGTPITLAVIVEAMQMVHHFAALGAQAVEVFPRNSGGILVSAYQGKMTVEAYLGRDLSVELDVENGETEIASEPNLSIAAALKKVGEAGWLSEPLSDSLIHNIILAWSSNASSLPPSKTQTTVYQSFYNPVSTTQGWVFVNTRPNTTEPISQVTRRSSGASQKNVYQMAVR
jgi:hypothetical protein